MKLLSNSCGHIDTKRDYQKPQPLLPNISLLNPLSSSLQSIPSINFLCTTSSFNLPFPSKKNLSPYQYVHHHILPTISRKRSRHVTISAQRPDVSQIRFRVDDSLLIFRLLLDHFRHLPPILSTLLTLPTPSSILGVPITTLAILHVGFLLRHELRYVILFIFRQSFSVVGMFRVE